MKHMKIIPSLYSLSRGKTLNLVIRNPDIFSYINSKFSNDLQFVLIVVKKCGKIIELVSDEFRSDDRVIMASIPTHYESIRYLSECSTSNIHIFNKAFAHSGGVAFHYIVHNLHTNLRLINSAILYTIDQDYALYDYPWYGTPEGLGVVFRNLNDNLYGLMYFLNIGDNDYTIEDFLWKCGMRSLVANITSFLSIMIVFPDNKLRTNAYVDTHFLFI